MSWVTSTPRFAVAWRQPPRQATHCRRCAAPGSDRPRRTWDPRAEVTKVALDGDRSHARRPVKQRGRRRQVGFPDFTIAITRQLLRPRRTARRLDGAERARQGAHPAADAYALVENDRVVATRDRANRANFDARRVLAVPTLDMRRSVRRPAFVQTRISLQSGRRVHVHAGHLAGTACRAAIRHGDDEAVHGRASARDRIVVSDRRGARDDGNIDQVSWRGR